MTKYIVLCLLLLGCTSSTFTPAPAQKPADNSKPRISFTFDDGQTRDIGGMKLETWNEQLLKNLKKHNLKAILFSSGENKTSERGRYVLKSWDDAGHLIANHTFSHKNFNRDDVSLAFFQSELLKNDSIIRNYTHYTPYFRFPYLKEGNTREKAEGFRKFMQENGYKNGHVSVDASDWYIDSRLVKRLLSDPAADVSGYRDYYVQHLLQRATFYDSVASVLTGRKINHVLLLHHNLAAALFLDDLITHFENNGWEVIDADEAYTDKVYDEVPTHIPAGESLIWALAKQSGKFEKVLRYPAEDGAYEKPFMDKLGL